MASIYNIYRSGIFLLVDNLLGSINEAPASSCKLQRVRQELNEEYTYKVRIVDVLTGTEVLPWVAPDMVDIESVTCGADGADFIAYFENIGIPLTTVQGTVSVGLPGQGAATTAGSIPVNIASDQVVKVADQPGTPFRLISAASINATVIKISPGTLLSIYATNTNAAARFVKVYDSAVPPDVSTMTPIFTFRVAALTGSITYTPAGGVACVNGIAIIETALIGDTDATAVAANDIILQVTYR